MTPDLALTLSFEGIGLLTRVKGGWHLLGEAALDADDLAAELSVLRDMAVAVNGADFVTMLVLPNDQIKFLSLNMGRIKDKQRWALVATALEDHTPYHAEQLAFDLTVAGRETQVAAVARDTLDEAEAFATEHAFNPICFTAAPLHEVYSAAPDFGPTMTATRLGLVPVCDAVPIVVLEHSAQPRVEPKSDVGDAKTDPVADPQTDLQTALYAAAQSQEEAVSTNPVASLPEMDATPSDEARAAETNDEADTPAEPPMPFASIRAQRDGPQSAAAPGLTGVTRLVTGTNAPSLPMESSATADTPLRFDPAKVVAGLKPGAVGRSDPRPADGSAVTGTAGGSFFSRRQTKSSKGAKFSARGSGAAKLRRPQQDGASQQQRMSVFGSHSVEVRGKPRHLGLIMTTVLLVLLAAVAIWAAVFLEDGVTGLLPRENAPQIAVLDPQPTAPVDGFDTTTPRIQPSMQMPLTRATPERLSQPEPDSLAPQPGSSPLEEAAINTAVLEPTSPDSITDSAEIEALLDGQELHDLNQGDAEAKYAVTGIWQRAPQPPAAVTQDSSDHIYVASIDQALTLHDAVALPSPTLFGTDQQISSQLNPVASGTRFELDDRGLVLASRDGTLNPEGVLVFLGRPAQVPPNYPARLPKEGHTLTVQQASRLAQLRPRLRPSNLVEQNQRATLGGLTLNELARIRPTLRPVSAKAALELDTTPTQFAVKRSLRPRPKPANIAQLAQRAIPNAPVVAVASAAILTPVIPTTASVARQATIKNAINLRKVNLLGVYGTASNRRALVRLSSGRYKKVQVGDRIDGGKVAAISEAELRYVKSGKNIILKIPNG